MFTTIAEKGGNSGPVLTVAFECLVQQLGGYFSIVAQGDIGLVGLGFCGHMQNDARQLIGCILTIFIASADGDVLVVGAL